MYEEHSGLKMSLIEHPNAEKNIMWNKEYTKEDKTCLKEQLLEIC